MAFVPSMKLFGNKVKQASSHPSTARDQMLSTSVLTFFLFLLYSFTNHPFHERFQTIVLISSVFHFALYLTFEKTAVAHRSFVLVSIFSTVLLGFAVHYSGGIISPFILSFFCIVISDISNKVHRPIGLITSIIVYTAVVAGEYFGVLNVVDISTSSIYSNGVVTLAIVTGTGVLLLVTGQSYKIIMNSLYKAIDKEQEQKQAVLKKLIQLEAPSQIGLLVNKIVHDIRGPLGAISGFIKIIQNDSGLTAVSRYDCKLMLEELERIRELMNRMIKYVRPTESVRSPICPIDLFNTALAVVSFYPGAKRIEFERDFPKTEKFLIHANKEELQQVVFNILKNSSEAMELVDHPRIRIHIYAKGDTLYIAIQDNGKGMPQPLSSRISYERISTKTEGAGVGLIIAREILEAHNGGIEFQSEEGKGTIALIRLPLYEQQLEMSKEISSQTKDTVW